jgi:hypothetical protein
MENPTMNDMPNPQHVDWAVYEYRHLTPRMPPSFADRSWTIRRKLACCPRTHVSILGVKRDLPAVCKEAMASIY